MKKVQFKGTIETAYGEKLAEPLEYQAEFDKLESMSEATDKDTLTEEEILDVINNRRKATARQTGMQAALKAAGVEAPAKDSAKVLTRNFMRTLTLAGRTEEEARSIARNALGDKYEE